MINEILYMQLRLFRMFCDKYKLTAKNANKIFNDHKIWEYVNTCYDMLHLSGDDVAMDDIVHILRKSGVQL